MAQRKWKKLVERTSEEKAMARALVKLREYLRSQSKSTTGVVTRKISGDGRVLLVKIAKSGSMTVALQMGKSHYYTSMTTEQEVHLQYTVPIPKWDPDQDQIVDILKSAFKRFYPEYNVKAKTTSAATIAKRLIPEGYASSINTDYSGR